MQRRCRLPATRAIDTLKLFGVAVSNWWSCCLHIVLFVFMLELLSSAVGVDASNYWSCCLQSRIRDSFDVACLLVGLDIRLADITQYYVWCMLCSLWKQNGCWDGFILKKGIVRLLVQWCGL